MAQTPALGAVSKIVRILKERGSMSPGELLREVGVTKRTFYRALGALRDAGVIREESGFYYWYEHLETAEYQSEFEAEQALNHSRNIASGLQHLLERNVRDYAGGGLGRAEYAEYALTHLRTGYSGTYKDFQEAENVKRQTNENENKLIENIKAKLIALSLRVSYPTYVPEIVLADIKEVLRGRKPYFITDLKVEDEKVKSGAYADLAKKEEFQSLKQFIIKEEMLKENMEYCRGILEMEHEYITLWQRFRKEIEVLLMQVGNGMPLKGGCQICPKVKVRVLPS